MNCFSELCICNTFNFPIDQQTYEECVNNIPSNVFGVFVTVRRSKYQKLKKWPEDIHGCQGYWNNNFSKMSKDLLIKKMLQVALSATYQDSRKDYFGPVYRDALASFDVYFMLTPLIHVDSNTGLLHTPKKKEEVFDNKKYGLIYTDESGQRATFLPHVFENKSWKYIKQQIIGKAGASNNGQFVAYKAKTFCDKMISLFNSRYLNFLLQIFIKSFIEKHYEKFVPYEVTKNSKIVVKKNEYVRNIATLYDIIQVYKHLNHTSYVLHKVNRDIEEYIKLYQEIPVELRQASSFLLMSLKELEMDYTLQNSICDHLYNAIPRMERKFELGECLIALANVCPNKEILQDMQKKMSQYQTTNKNLPVDDIFRLNWDSKFLYALKKNNLYDPSMLNDAIHLTNQIHNIYVQMWNNTVETNYLAVTFEAFTSLIPFITGEVSIELYNNIFSLFYFLEQRRNKMGLYAFLNGTARVDITGHVLNGLLILQKLK